MSTEAPRATVDGCVHLGYHDGFTVGPVAGQAPEALRGLATSDKLLMGVYIYHGGDNVGLAAGRAQEALRALATPNEITRSVYTYHDVLV